MGENNNCSRLTFEEEQLSWQCYKQLFISGLTISPNTSLKKKGIRRSGILSSNPSTPTILSEKSEISVSSSMIRQRRPDSVPPCYQVSSLNENKAKQLCRRSPIGVIKYPFIRRKYITHKFFLFITMKYLQLLIYRSQTCIKRSPLGQGKVVL